MTCLLQPTLSLAAVTASLQVVKPTFCLSPTVLLHVTFGCPLVLFPSGVQVRAMRGFCWLFIRSTCPIQRHLRLLICSLIVQVLARRLTSSFDTFIGQYISLVTSVDTCVEMCPVLLHPYLSFSKFPIHKVALL